MTVEPSSTKSSRKRGRWWNFEGSDGGGNVLELQPLYGVATINERHYNNANSSTAPSGTLERILGLDTPIMRRVYDNNGESSTYWKRFYYSSPPDVPVEIQLWRRENIAILAC